VTVPGSADCPESSLQCERMSFARRHPDDPKHIHAVRLPDHLRKLIE
jgi:hypothetical protein